jgi:hypothetical protein
MLQKASHSGEKYLKYFNTVAKKAGKKGGEKRREKRAGKFSEQHVTMYCMTQRACEACVVSTRNQSYDFDLQRQCCKNLHRHG